MHVIDMNIIGRSNIAKESLQSEMYYANWKFMHNDENFVSMFNCFQTSGSKKYRRHS